MDWQQAVKDEGLVDIIKDMGDGWWLFQIKNHMSYNSYSGVLGWQ